MDLFRKVRVLVGAIAHGPAQRRRNDAESQDKAGTSQEKTRPASPTNLAKSETGVQDTDRVADLIAQQREDQAN